MRNKTEVIEKIAAIIERTVIEFHQHEKICGIDIAKEVIAECRAQVIEEIDPHILNAIFQLHNDEDFESEMDWWQQFKGG